MPAIIVSEDVSARLAGIASARKRDTGRAVTYGDVISFLLGKETPMAEVNETTQRRCDRCGAQSEPGPKGSVPAGWLAGLGLHVQASFAILGDLCPACAALPVNQAIVLPAPAEESA